MGVTVLFYKLFQFKNHLAAIFKRYCCHGNVTYKFRLYRYVTRTNVSFFDPSPNDQRTEHSCA